MIWTLTAIFNQPFGESFGDKFTIDGQKQKFVLAFVFVPRVKEILQFKALWNTKRHFAFLWKMFVHHPVEAFPQLLGDWEK